MGTACRSAAFGWTPSLLLLLTYSGFSVFVALSTNTAISEGAMIAVIQSLQKML